MQFSYGTSAAQFLRKWAKGRIKITVRKSNNGTSEGKDGNAKQKHGLTECWGKITMIIVE